MSDQLPLIVEDYLDAIRATVQALGGAKRIGSDMKPDLSVEAAGRWLSDCCNPDRRERLSPSELAYIRKRARAAGVHIMATFEMRDAGYADPTPVEPEDQRAALQRAFIQQTEELKRMLGQLHALGVSNA